MIIVKQFYNDRITVIDGLFNNKELLDIYELASQTSFCRSSVDVHLLPNRDIDVKWRSDISALDPLFRYTILTYQEKIDALDWSKVTIKSHYLNFSVPSTVDMIHSDSRGFEKNGKTLLHYANYTWDKNWHGQTNFYSDNVENIVYSCMIKPGRVILFDGTIPHSATAPSTVAVHPRYTIATKIVVND